MGVGKSKAGWLHPFSLLMRVPELCDRVGDGSTRVSSREMELVWGGRTEQPEMSKWHLLCNDPLWGESSQFLGS